MRKPVRRPHNPKPRNSQEAKAKQARRDVNKDRRAYEKAKRDSK